MRTEPLGSTARRLREARLEAVARSFVRDKPARSCGVLVSCADDAAATSAIGRGLSAAAKELALSHVILGREASATSADSPRLWAVQAGGVNEQWLSHLEPPREPSIDLLLWHSDVIHRPFLRESYLLGMVAWSLRPRKTVVLLDAEPAVREEMRGALSTLQLESAEILGVPSTGGLVSILRQTLSSTLSAKSRRERAR